MLRSEIGLLKEAQHIWTHEGLSRARSKGVNAG